MISKEDIELFCKYRNTKYISHRDVGDGSFVIKMEVEIRATEREIEPYINQQKLKDAKND